MSSDFYEKFLEIIVAYCVIYVIIRMEVLIVGLKENIKAKRLQQNMTLEELAKKVNTSKQTIQRYESGVIANIPSDRIEQIAAALHTTPASLMGWDRQSEEEEAALPAAQTIGRNIRYLRESLSLTQRELGEAMQVSDRTVSTWESGFKKPRSETLDKLAGFFGVDRDALIAPPLSRSAQQNPTEQKLLLLARKVSDIPPEQRDRIIKTFEDTIDLYLKATELSKEK